MGGGSRSGSSARSSRSPSAPGLLNSLTGGSPGGPTSSAYATGADGLAGYFSLLADEGHQVERRRALPTGTALSAGATAVVLDPGFVSPKDARALRAFVEGGGRLVTGGGSESSLWLRPLLQPTPQWSATAVKDARQLAPAPDLGGPLHLRGAGDGSWKDTGAALAVYGNAKRSIVAIATLGLGRVILLADASPLQDRYLGAADNARFALAAAGPQSRPVVFFESYHGYGPATGYDSIPARWQALIGGLALAAFALMVARGRRLGPPEAEGRTLPPPRRVYVDSLAGVVARTKRPDEALEPVRRETKARLARRAGLGDDAAHRCARSRRAARRAAGCRDRCDAGPAGQWRPGSRRRARACPCRQTDVRRDE